MEKSFEPSVPSLPVHQLRQSLARAETNNRKLEERLSLLISSVKDYAIFLLDEEGYVSSWNEGAQRNQGYTAKEIIGKHFSVFYTPEDIERNHPKEELEIALREGRYEEEGWRVRKDGTRFWANVVITTLRDDYGIHIGFAKVTRDMTERRQAQEKLRLALENMEKRVIERTLDLSESNRKLKEAVRARDEFLSIASHELRTPITPLKLQIQNLALQIKSGVFFKQPMERSLATAQMLERSITKLSSLLENLLDVSRLDSGKFRLDRSEDDLVLLTKELMERYRGDIAAVGSTATLDAPESLMISCDRLRIEQVITNLIINAVKYGEGRPITIRIAKDGDIARIAVEDRGTGIAERDQKRIFERFERATEESHVGGLGLGLYITRQIVEAHGGTIRVESVLGQGSKFIVELPITETDI